MGHRPELVGECDHQCHPGWGGKFLAVGDASARHVPAGEQFDNSRSWVGQLAVGGMHRALPDRDRTADDPLDTEHFECGTGTDDVDDRVDRPDLVELDVVGRHAMHRALDVRKRGEGGQRSGGNPRRQIRRRDEFANRPVGTVLDGTVLVVMVMVVAVIAVVYDHVSLCRGDPAAQHRFEAECVVVERQASDDLGDRQLVGTGVNECRHRHVASGARKAVEPRGADWSAQPRGFVGGTHGSILAIADAAPKPLSIPTTVMPLAHDACIASSAVTPSRPAP